jgi:hypothetical protein
MSQTTIMSETVGIAYLARPVLFLAIVLVIAASECPCSAEPTTNANRNVIRLEFANVDRSRLVNTPISNLTLFVSADKTQPYRNGIVLLFQIVNTSTTDVTINNPLDYMTFVVLREGWPVELPAHTGPRALINTLNPMITKRPYKIVDVVNGKGEKGLLEKAESEELTIYANSFHNIRIRIDQLRYRDPQNKNAVMLKPAQVKKGEYELEKRTPAMLFTGHLF